MPFPSSDQREVKAAVRRTRRIGRALQASVERAPFDPVALVRHEVRVGHIDGNPVDRLVLFLRGAGCEWMQRGGGCTMCGFYLATIGVAPSKDAFLAQLRSARTLLGERRFAIVSIYNDGSLLNHEETSSEALLALAQEIRTWPGIRAVVVESRAEYVTHASVSRLVQALDGIALQIALGFESTHDDVRNVAINKGLSKDAFLRAADVMRRAGAHLRPLVLVKPPFLTELEAIEDCLATVQYLSALEPVQIDLEAMTVEKGTLTQALWALGLYRPPNLWTLIEILRRSAEPRLYMSPFAYSVQAVDVPSSCPECEEVLKQMISTYNVRFDRAVLAGIDCVCRAEWRQTLEVEDCRPIARRVLDGTDALERACSLKHRDRH